DRCQPPTSEDTGGRQGGAKGILPACRTCRRRGLGGQRVTSRTNLCRMEDDKAVDPPAQSTGSTGKRAEPPATGVDAPAEPPVRRPRRGAGSTAIAFITPDPAAAERDGQPVRYAAGAPERPVPPAAGGLAPEQRPANGGGPASGGPAGARRSRVTDSADQPAIGQPSGAPGSQQPGTAAPSRGDAAAPRGQAAPPPRGQAAPPTVAAASQAVPAQTTRAVAAGPVGPAQTVPAKKAEARKAEARKAERASGPVEKTGPAISGGDSADEPASGATPRKRAAKKTAAASA